MFCMFLYLDESVPWSCDGGGELENKDTQILVLTLDPIDSWNR